MQGVAELCFIDRTCDDRMLDRRFCYFNIICGYKWEEKKVIKFFVKQFKGFEDEKFRKSLESYQ